MTSFEPPKHGTSITIDGRKPEVKECLKHIRQLHDDATVMLILLLASIGFGEYRIPCRQCMAEMALQFKDLGAAIDELLEIK